MNVPVMSRRYMTKLSYAVLVVKMAIAKAILSSLLLYITRITFLYQYYQHYNLKWEFPLTEESYFDKCFNFSMSLIIIAYLAASFEDNQNTLFYEFTKARMFRFVVGFTMIFGIILYPLLCYLEEFGFDSEKYYGD